MIYFCGNDVIPTDVFRVVEGIVFFPSVFWVFPGYMDDEKFLCEFRDKVGFKKYVDMC